MTVNTEELLSEQAVVETESIKEEGEVASDQLHHRWQTACPDLQGFVPVNRDGWLQALPTFGQ